VSKPQPDVCRAESKAEILKKWERVMADIRIRLIIEGRVQGVWFRDSTRRQAVALGVTGWVRNRPGGTVEVLAEGPEDRVRRLQAWCRQGPSAARVTQVHENPETWRGEFDSFDIVF
jgi:acylphosphatase